MKIGLIIAMMCCAALGGPATQRVDPELWQRMGEIDGRGGKIVDLSAEFVQEKYTALLKRPLISSGTVRVRGSAMRWVTEQPEPTVLRVDEHEVRIYYPKQKIIEVYGVEQKLASLAASPLPRLDVLKEHFSFEEMPVGELDPSAEPGKYLGLRMKPTDAALKEHIDEVRVLLDVQRGYIVRLEMTDSDGDRSVIRFLNVQINTGLAEKDVEIHAPAGVKVTRPLAAVEGK